MSERVAILVIHGIGKQQPYQILDQFSRNLFSSLNRTDPGWLIEPQLDRQTDPTGADSTWVRVAYRLAPPPGAEPVFSSDPDATIEDITLFEDYWAPITQDKITYAGSLLFLARAGFEPFLYLAANLKALGDAQALKRFFPILFKELLRQALLFVPLLLLFGILLWWLQATTLQSLLMHVHFNAVLVVSIIFLFIRYLYLSTGILALRASLGDAVGWQRKPLWRAALLGGLAFHLFAWPFLLAPTLTLVAALGMWLARKQPSFPYLHHFGPWSVAVGHFASLVRFPSAHPAWSERVVAFLLLTPALRSYSGQAFALLLIYWVRYILINYVGDVAVYVSGRRSATTLSGRARILQQCSRALSDLLLERDPTTGRPVYDRVLIAAHSLGSVIAYDTMNVLLNIARTAVPGDAGSIQCGDLKRLRGLITFGSPLNKIFYFFREQGDPKLVLRRQTLDILKSFRVVPAIRTPALEPAFLPSTDPRWIEAEQALEEGFCWINAYSLSDPISGRIVFYKVDQQVRYEYPWPFLAHLAYMEDPRLYTFFRQYLL